MSRNLLIISMVLMCLACRAMSQEEHETQILIGGVDYSPALRVAGETYRTAVEKVQNASQAVKSFAKNSYEDHVRPIVEPSVTWVTEATSAVWDKIKTSLSDYWIDPDSQERINLNISGTTNGTQRTQPG
ncbi:hypothetical protein SKAU_G00405850 [Synaphobranchus kaupii]|uniref:Uncharacterized protein n=1 Tax=Synaphobranchus kaupii TaxID=118154 RepID=A0A9Q1EA10_SYNKA|nr:hypothetical protein SKAU_G00405850 [Synaphobranchus kaupii]